MKKNTQRLLILLLVIAGTLHVGHLWWWFSFSSTPSNLSNKNNETKLDESYERANPEGGETLIHEKLPTDDNSKIFSRLIPMEPTPFPVSNNLYNTSLYSQFESMQSSECFAFTEDIAYSSPLERKGIQTPTNVSSDDMVELWKDFQPSQVRVIMTPNMLQLSSNETLRNSLHLSPIIENSHIKETEFEEFYRKNYLMFKIMSEAPIDSQSSTLDYWKQEMNKMNFVFNSHKFNENQKKDHLPIWIRVFQRTFPLNDVLESLCKVNNIEESILIVTIDGNGFLPVIESLLKVECVKIRVYFHAFSHTSQHFVNGNSKLLEKAMSMKSFKLFAHALYGLYLCLVKFKYPYVITIEDDIRPLPDFYNYHRSLYRFTLDEKSPFLSVLSLSGGVNHNCNFISSALYESGFIRNMPYDSLGLKYQVCSINDVDHVVPEAYHAIWGSGISFRLFRRMWFTWLKLDNRLDFFLGTILRDLRKKNERNFAPCSNRVEQIANNGVNGGYSTNPRFYHLVAPVAAKRQSQQDVKDWSYRGRQYTMFSIDGFTTDHLET